MQVEKILKKIISDENFKLYPPIQEISHMSLNNLFIFLNISFKNFLTMNLEGLNEFFRFLYELEIIEKCDLEKEVNLNEKQNENALKLLKKLNYVNKENNSKEQDEIKRVLIKLLKDKGYKSDNEYIFTLKDKINFLKLLNEEEIVKSRHYQEKNKEIIKKLEAQNIKILDKTFKELFLYFFDSSKKDQEYLNDFKKFYDDIKKIDENFYKEKKYHLIPEEKDNKKDGKGFIDYVEDYSVLSLDKKKKLKNLMEYFKGKEINFDEIEKYKQSSK